jgi:VTC domain-containing protein
MTDGSRAQTQREGGPSSIIDGAVAAAGSPTGNGQPTPDASDTLSPSLLWPTSTAASYELKFLLTCAAGQRVEAWARQHLALDPHADASMGNAYGIRSVYFDTDRLDVFHRSRSYRRRKFRLRRYGNERGVFLERKSRSADRVAKRRTLICDEELSRLDGAAADAAWPGYWFHRRLLVRHLRPRCVIRYERVAHVGISVEGPLRLTLDRHIHCALTEGYDFAPATAAIPLLAESVVLELKFRSAMPALFKRLIQEMGLNPGSVSKYRLGIQAWGLTASREVG